MELKQGYKQTEVGLIPEDWELKKFTDCATLKHGFQFREEHFSSDGIKVVKIGTLKYSGELDFNNVTYVPYSDLKKFSNFLLSNGDILMALTGATLGKCSIVKTNETLLQNYRVGNFYNKSICTKGYIYVILKSDFIQKTFKKLVNEAAQPNIGKGDFDKFIIPIPSLPEQTAIANALSDMDSLISQTEKLIEKKKAIKQGAMQELLKPKEGWVTKKLGDVCEIIMGQSPLSEYYNIIGDGLPLVQGNADIKNRKTIIRNYSSFITKKGKSGDIIMTVRAPVGEIAVAGFECCLGRGVCAMRYDNNFMYHYLVSMENYWSKLSSGSTFDSVNSNQIRDLSVSIPQNQKEQIEIANTLSDLDDDIELTITKMQKLKQQKQGMMQALLTGKIRLVS